MERYGYETVRDHRRWLEYGILDRKSSNSEFIAVTSERWAAENIVNALNEAELARELEAAVGGDIIGAAVDAIVDFINEGGTDAADAPGDVAAGEGLPGLHPGGGGPGQEDAQGA